MKAWIFARKQWKLVVLYKYNRTPVCLKKLVIELTMKNIEYLKENEQAVLHGVDAINLLSCFKGTSTSNIREMNFCSVKRQWNEKHKALWSKTYIQNFST